MRITARACANIALVKYWGKRDSALNLPAAGATQVFYSPDYWVHNAFLSYEITRALTAQVNVKNATDSLYYTRIRNNGWATPGDGRSAVLSLNYRF